MNLVNLEKLKNNNDIIRPDYTSIKRVNRDNDDHDESLPELSLSRTNLFNQW